MFQSSRDHFQVVYIYKYLCAFKVSSAWQPFHIECDRLTQTFSQLQYPAQLLQLTISNFVTKKVSGDPISTQSCNVNEAPVRVVLPQQIDIRPVYTSHKIGHEIKPKEKKPPIINQPHVVYHYKCGLCNQTMLGIHADNMLTPLSAH